MSVVKSKRSIPNQQEFLDVDNLLRHTLKVTSNENIFLPCYKGLTDEIVRTAVTIYTKCFEAYNIRIRRDDYYINSINLRTELQRDAILECKNFLNLLNVAYSIYHLRGQKVDYWASLAIKARTSITRWRKRDIEAYKKW